MEYERDYEFYCSYQPGNYYYTANDSNGCAIHSDTNTVTENPLPIVNATASPDTICPGGSSILSSGAVAQVLLSCGVLR